MIRDSGTLRSWHQLGQTAQPANFKREYEKSSVAKNLDKTHSKKQLLGQQKINENFQIVVRTIFGTELANLLADWDSEKNMM